MIDFTVQDNFILTKGSIVAVFEIEPVDVILLPDQEQRAFEADLHRTLNGLGGDQVQLIMRTRKAEPEDFRKHFKDLSTQGFKFKSKKMQTTMSDLVQDYISSLSQLLEDNIIPVKEYYVVFKADTNTQNKAKLSEAIKNLGRLIERFTGNLSRTGIKTKQVVNYHTIEEEGREKTIQTRELEKLVSSFIRL